LLIFVALQNTQHPVIRTCSSGRTTS